MKKILAYLGKFMLVVSVCTLIGSIAVGVYQIKETVNTLEVTQKAEGIIIDTLSNIFIRHTQKQEIVNKEVIKELNDYGRVQKNLKGYMIENAKSTEELKNLIKIWDVEKKK